MRYLGFRSLLALALYGTYVSAQTHSKCNPMGKDTICEPNPALASRFGHSFAAKGESPRMIKTQQGAVSYEKDGCHLTITTAGESGPQLESDFYIMYGEVEVTMKSAPGNGIISAITLLSDTLDEIDFEFINSEPDRAQTVYFAHGDDKINYDRGEAPPVTSHADWHTYRIVWKPQYIHWFIDGVLVRELTPEGTKKYKGEHTHFPRSPMEVKIGAWAAGDKLAGDYTEGRAKWAGGLTDFSKGPFTMVVESVRVVDYSKGKSYFYADKSGTLESVRAEGGEIFETPGQGAPIGSSSTTSSSSSTSFSSSSTTTTSKGTSTSTSRSSTKTNGPEPSQPSPSSSTSSSSSSSSVSTPPTPPSPTSSSKNYCLTTCL
ncbi:concanavalin A-like lectin/glucanase [Ascobolus immersus RN42]|uniref:Concanavalin A-like lectin/glucanase n=1 Tax=Ascobolus immersus RN42 TaxID=1160509 RepID=A0A3N4IGW7_ASCIM|nr:concanavalin A-like lectin/glucanase [Ascobolus immersus RN42]